MGRPGALWAQINSTPLVPLALHPLGEQLCNLISQLTAAQSIFPITSFSLPLAPNQPSKPTVPAGFAKNNPMIVSLAKPSSVPWAGNPRGAGDIL